MDELELLKKDWQRKGQTLPKLSYDQIYNMIWKKSSSIVKWIFYISIIEFLFWILLIVSFNFFDSFNDEDSMKMVNEIYHLLTFQIVNFIYYAGLIAFIYLFFLNYKRISSIDNVKTLLKNILKTRRTVNYYVWFNLLYFAVGSIISFNSMISRNSNIINLHEQFTNNGNESMFYISLYGLAIFLIAIFGFIIWLFYKLLYGILLGKLKKNYGELKKIDL